MSMKQGRLPKWAMVIRDLKRGPVQIAFKEHNEDITTYVTLSNQLIPDKHMAESNPNNPTELDKIKAWDTERQKWITFNISELNEYETAAPMWQKEDQDGNEERETVRDGQERTGNRTTERVQREEETQTNDRGTEGQGKGESGEGKGRTWSSQV